jgi:antirestriction protein ArdC
MSNKSAYKSVTNKIVALLEAGKVPWQKPWNPEKAGGSGPKNATSGNNYRGINSLILGCHPLSFESGDPRWSTYKQAKESGWQVRKDERSSTIYFFKKVTTKAEEAQASRERREARLFPVLRSYGVFHASQIDGINEYAPPTLEQSPWSRPDEVQTILDYSGVALRTGGEKAFYSPSTDHIQLPPDVAFSTKEAWSATALHELGHATGHKDRLDRDLSGRFGSKAYAMEELRAELASAFLAQELGVPSSLENHASYLDSWIEVLKSDHKEIFRASADAQKMSDWCLQRHPDYRFANALEPLKSAELSPPMPGYMQDAIASMRGETPAIDTPTYSRGLSL